MSDRKTVGIDFSFKNTYSLYNGTKTYDSLKT